jgi:Rad3-related DNA helicase
MLKLNEKYNELISEKLSSNILIDEHEQLLNLFSNQINENEDKRNDVIKKIQSNDWEEHNAENFYNALYQSKHKEMLTNYNISELNQMKLFKLQGYNIGFALKKFKDNQYNEIVAVFNNEPEVSNIGKILMQAAINNGGCYLDHFDGFLSGLYQSMGFEEYDRYKFDPQYDPEGKFQSKYGQADVIFRKHKNCQ